MQSRLDQLSDATGLRRQTVEHVFDTLRACAGRAPFLTRTLEKIRTEMSLAVLAYNMKRMIQLFGINRCCTRSEPDDQKRRSIAQAFSHGLGRTQSTTMRQGLLVHSAVQ